MKHPTTRYFVVLLAVLLAALGYTLVTQTDTHRWAPPVEKISYWNNGTTYDINKSHPAHDKLKQALLTGIDRFKARETLTIAGDCQERYRSGNVIYLEFVEPLNITRNGYPITSKAYIFHLGDNHRVRELSPDGSCGVFGSNFDYATPVRQSLSLAEK